ncbi:hypothetical protein A3K79_00880 [Candidatus Bathyarchaeota archaeon RBG_13_46_16b]|nr:MAG: hypothetical protein A3K79_00880 [Candidatus Bathyarchaeota archaeon RBG_13_46_16b]
MDSNTNFAQRLNFSFWLDWHIFKPFVQQTKEDVHPTQLVAPDQSCVVFRLEFRQLRVAIFQSHSKGFRCTIA